MKNTMPVKAAVAAMRSSFYSCSRHKRYMRNSGALSEGRPRRTAAKTSWRSLPLHRRKNVLIKTNAMPQQGPNRTEQFPRQRHTGNVAVLAIGQGLIVALDGRRAARSYGRRFHQNPAQPRRTGTGNVAGVLSF